MLLTASRLCITMVPAVSDVSDRSAVLLVMSSPRSLYRSLTILIDQASYGMSEETAGLVEESLKA